MTDSPAAEQVWVHPSVREFGDQLAADADHPVLYEKIGNTEWRIVIDNGRVRMTVDYRLTGRNRLLHAGSTLAIDGQRVALASSYDDFLRIFADPAAHGTPMPVREVDQADATDLGEPVALDRAPGKIREMVEAAQAKMPEGTDVRIGRVSNRWTLAMTNGGIVLRMSFTGGQIDTGRPHRRFPFKMARQRPIELWIDGVDLTDQVQGRLDIALGLINGGAHAAAPAPAPVRGEHGVPGRATGVVVRNTHVIRN